MFFFWQVIGASSAHSRLLPHLKITNALERAGGMTGAEHRHVVWPLSSAAPTSSLPGKHQQPEPGLVAKRRCQQKFMVLCVTWRSSLRFPVVGHCPEVKGQQGEHAPHPALTMVKMWDVCLAVRFTRSLGLLVEMSSADPPQDVGMAGKQQS